MATGTSHWFGAPGGLDSPASHVFLITPNDAADISYVTRALFIGGAGNIKVDTLGGETVVISGIVAGSVLPLAVKRVHATSTTCTNIAGLY